MAFFTRRDRIAVAVLGTLILAGWGVRLCQLRTTPDDGIGVIRGAVTPPPVASAADSTGHSEAPSALSPATRIDLNRATAANLETLPMIGPKKAADIVRWRAEHGPFGKPEDIMNVKGIGKKTYARIAPYIAVTKP